MVEARDICYNSCGADAATPCNETLLGLVRWPPGFAGTEGDCETVAYALMPLARDVALSFRSFGPHSRVVFSSLFGPLDRMRGATAVLRNAGSGSDLRFVAEAFVTDAGFPALAMRLETPDWDRVPLADSRMSSRSILCGLPRLLWGKGQPELFDDAVDFLADRGLCPAADFFARGWENPRPPVRPADAFFRRFLWACGVD